nr:RNA-directed DNA polymerase, eukaryota [Tanacetum cinerariifolium]
MHRKRSMEVNGSSPVGIHGPSIFSASVLVLDDSCVAEPDLSNQVMGNVKDVSSISNLRTLIMDEGFSVVNLVYLGGLWMMIECDNVETKANMLQHTGVKSWFHVLQNAVNEFVSDERIVWVDIKGIPLNAWSRETFTRIGKKWGEALDIEDNFCEEGHNDDRSSDVEEVSETKFRHNSSISINHIDELEKQQFEDPFNIYRLLRKQPGDESHEVSSSLSHPPGFTPDVSVIQNENGQSAKEISVVVNAKVMNNSQDVYKEASCDNVDLNVVKKEGKAVGNSGGILCVWEATLFKKDYDTISDNFFAIYGTWLPSNSKVLFVAIYAPQQVSRKQLLWDYVSTLIDRLVDVKMEGYTFTWSHPSWSKMNKLDRFLFSKGIFLIFPSITAVCLDRHLLNHHPIILYEVQADFGPIPVWFYHSWISLEGFDAMVEQTWRSFSHNNANKMICFKKKIQDLKVRIQAWVKDKRLSVSGEKDSIKKELSDIDRLLDGGDVSDSNLLRKRLSDVQASDLERRVSRDKIRLAVWNCGENKSLGLDEAFGINNIWCKWIRGTFSSAKASVLVNGSPTIEFPIHCGLKQGDPLSPYLVILIMESLNMSFTHAIDEGVFKGVHLHGSTSISHLFYADDVMFIGEWSDDNLKDGFAIYVAMGSSE